MILSFPLRCLFCSTLLVANTVHADETKLNVLMIIVDDLAPVLSSYGGPVETPALDSLAAEGVRFTNNYANAPVCGASRASFLSGLAPTASRFLSYDARLDQEVENAVSLPAYFQNEGWHTLANGKVFDVIADSSSGWSEPVWSPEHTWFGKDPDERGEHLQAAYIEPSYIGRPPYFEKLDVEDSAYPDGQIAAKTAADLHRLAKSDKPFFLAVGFRKPHLPFNAPAAYWSPEKREEEPGNLPATWHAPAQDIPKDALHRSLELRGQYDALPLFGDPNDEEASEIIAAYHAAVRYADAQVGHVLRALNDSGLANETLVIVLGDHGFLLGEQRMWTKHALFEPALRTPLIISHPGVQGAREAQAITDLLDIYPTIVDLAGLEVPDYLDGVTLRPVLNQPELTQRRNKEGSISRWMNGESVRTDKYRYTRWFDKEGQTTDQMLFDLVADPREQFNLAEKSASAEVVSALGGILERQRALPVWSDKLETQYGLWSLAAKPSAGVLLLALTYPVTALVILLLILMAAIAFWRSRRKRAQ